MKLETISELTKFFHVAKSAGHAIEVHTTSEIFKEEIDLIPYNMVADKEKWYTQAVYPYEDISKGIQQVRLKIDGVEKIIKRLEINTRYSEENYKDPTLVANAGIVEVPVEKAKEELMVQIKYRNPNNKSKICTKCGKEMHVDTSKMNLSNPPQYTAKCDCGHITWVPTHQIDDIVEWVEISDVLKRAGIHK